jgi:DNA (cytosine-5)-methyltransferase 1
VFLIASRDGDAFKFPKPTHGDPDAPGAIRDLFAQAEDVEPYRTAWDALSDVKPDAAEDLEPRGKWAALLPSIPEGQNYLWHTERMGGLPLFGWRRRYWSFLLKLAKNRPSWTIQAQPGPAVGPFHWENRRLSMRELCRIQTFPDDIVIQGKRGSVQKQVGNAVPSLLAEVLGREISSQLLSRRTKGGELKLLPTRREPIPPAEIAARVPARFRRLIGEHEAHPGTGKGYGAKARASVA